MKISTQGFHNYFNLLAFQTNFVARNSLKMAKQEQREHARLLYVNERITLKEVAERVNVTEKTVGKWCKDDNWDGLRKSMLSTRQAQITRWYKQLDSITERIENRDNIPTSAEADITSKITSNIKALEVQIGLGEIVETGKKLITFIQQVNLEDAKLFKNYFDEYINNRLKNG